MFWEDCGSIIFPSSSSAPRCRPLLGGVPRVGSPASTLLYGTPTSWYPSPSRFVSSRQTTCATAGGIRISQGSWGTLACMPCSSTPGQPPRRTCGPHCPLALRCCLPRRSPRRPTRLLTFRGSITGPTCSLSTLRPRRCRRTRKTRFRLVVSLVRAATAIHSPHGFQREVSVTLCAPSSSPRLCLAHDRSSRTSRPSDHTGGLSC